MNILIIGGSSGLGLELGLALKKRYKVFVTGRKNRSSDSGLYFIPFNIDSSGQMARKIEKLLSQVKHVDFLIYATGFYQDGLIDDLSEKDIRNMIDVGLTAPALILQKFLRKQKKLSGFIAISSTSGQIPRMREPIYAAIKSGLNMLAYSVSLDKRIRKTLIASPAGMKTNFWKDKKRKGILLDPKWVVGKIIAEFQKKFAYKHMLILREPPRTEIVEERL